MVELVIAFFLDKTNSITTDKPFILHKTLQP